MKNFLEQMQIFCILNYVLDMFAPTIWRIKHEFKVKIIYIVRKIT
jgi:hypothetical protein